jgi:hypothetical protein
MAKRWKANECESRQLVVTEASARAQLQELESASTAEKMVIGLVNVLEETSETSAMAVEKEVIGNVTVQRVVDEVAVVDLVPEADLEVEVEDEIDVVVVLLVHAARADLVLEDVETRVVARAEASPEAQFEVKNAVLVIVLTANLMAVTKEVTKAATVIIVPSLVVLVRSVLVRSAIKQLELQVTLLSTEVVCKASRF